MVAGDHLNANARSIKLGSLNVRAVEDYLNAAVKAVWGTEDEMRHNLQFPLCGSVHLRREETFLNSSTADIQPVQSILVCWAVLCH